MKNIIHIIIAVLVFSNVASAKDKQLKWTKQEIDAANTCASVKGMTAKERDVVLYTNLVRMFPRRFAQIELQSYVFNNQRSDHHKAGFLLSLIAELVDRPAAAPLQYSDVMQDYARCWAKESGKTGVTGHKRTKCADGNFGENCHYGQDISGIVVANSLLIDQGVPNLGHRENLLDTRYSVIGVGIADHARYGKCCVEDYDGNLMSATLKYHQTSEFTQEEYDRLRDIMQQTGNDVMNIESEGLLDEFITGKLDKKLLSEALMCIINKQRAEHNMQPMKLAKYSTAPSSCSGSCSSDTEKVTYADIVMTIIDFDFYNDYFFDPSYGNIELRFSVEAGDIKLRFTIW